MLVVMQQGATEPQIQAVIDRMVEMGFDVHRSTGVIHTVLGGVGGKEVDLEILVVMAGPCAVESEEQIERMAEIVASGGARVIRGGAFKPRSSPYSFQGLGE